MLQLSSTETFFDRSVNCHGYVMSLNWFLVKRWFLSSFFKKKTDKRIETEQIDFFSIKVYFIYVLDEEN